MDHMGFQQISLGANIYNIASVEELFSKFQSNVLFICWGLLVYIKLDEVLRNYILRQKLRDSEKHNIDR